MCPQLNGRMDEWLDECMQVNMALCMFSLRYLLYAVADIVGFGNMGLWTLFAWTLVSLKFYSTDSKCNITHLEIL